MKAKFLVGVVAMASLAPAAALAASQARTIEIAVTAKGFEPDRVKVKKGEPLKLVVTRKTEDTCATEIVIPDENIKADLPLNKPVTLSFTPKRSGEIRYTCGMNMVTGVLQVASNDARSIPAKSPTHESGDMQGMRGMAGMNEHHGGSMHRVPCGCMHRGTTASGS